jgi:hypothetical protein
MQKSASAIARAPNLERLSSLLELLVNQFGGPHQLYAFWLAEIERLKSTRRSGFRLLRFLEMLGNMEFLHDAELHERRKQSCRLNDAHRDSQSSACHRQTSTNSH